MTLISHSPRAKCASILLFVGFVCALVCFAAAPEAKAEQNGSGCYDGHASSAYAEGVRDGRSDAEHDRLANLQRDPFSNTRGQHDYEDGYTFGFENPKSSGYSRENPGKSRDQWRIWIEPNRNVVWHSPENADVWVQVDEHAPTLIASGKEGAVAATWMSSGHRYVFILRDRGGIEFARTEDDLC